ncbi:MAG: RagB/SusD family nutrient uptake outer membrane protein [Chloroflexota bacterium]
MKRINSLWITILLVLGLAGACKSDFLDIPPKGSLDQSVLATEKGVNALLIGAYSMLDGVSSSFGWEAASTNWVYGSIRGMEANKGTDSGDQPDINPIQTFSETPTNPYLNVKWREVYEAISRCNNAIVVANKALTANTITQEQADNFIKQAKALRGWYHFEAWRMWQKIPYVDENTVQDQISNQEDVSDKILADLQVGTTLPVDMGAVGRFNKTVCEVLLAKAKMQMKKDYAGALPLLTSARTGSKANGEPIGLAPTYGEIFDIENRNKIEAVYTVQYSVNDGSGAANAGAGEVLNFPYKGGGGSPGGCCGFFNPTQEFVNSFRTSGGLPLLDFSYNLQPVKSDQGLTPTQPFTPDAGPLDPRLDWTVGRRGIPYWDWGPHTGSDWIRDQTYSGPYNPKKQVYKKSQEGQYTEVGNWTSGYTANGYRMIRFADILLLQAECMIETGDLAGALANINLIRNRAANKDGFVKNADGTNAANYVIAPYTTLGTQDNARTILRMERKLELGMEGHRYFDLQRWGIVVTELNRVLTYEKTMPWGNALYGSATVGAEDVNFPIPQRQIDLSRGSLVQNR